MMTTSNEHNNAPAVPQDMRLVPVWLLERVEQSLGSFTSDEGWSQSDMDTMDSVSAMLAATPAPAPAQEPETALQKFTRFKVAETEGNPVEMLRAFCAFAMNSQDWFDVEPFFDLVREAIAARAAKPEQEVGLTDEQADAVSMALRRAWQLGQTYWQQADSDYISQHKKSEETQRKFEKLCDDTISALRAKGGKL